MAPPLATKATAANINVPTNSAMKALIGSDFASKLTRFFDTLTAFVSISVTFVLTVAVLFFAPLFF